MIAVPVWGGPGKGAAGEFRLDGPVKLSEAMQDLWRWAEFGKEDGLPSPEIVQIIESEDGTVWVNTAAGVAWYDGYEWQASKCEHAAKRPAPSQIQPFDRDTVLAVWDRGLVVLGKSSCRIVAPKYKGERLAISSVSGRVGGKLMVEDLKLNLYTWDGNSEEVEGRILENKLGVGSRIRSGSGGTVFAVSEAGVMRWKQQEFSVQLRSSALKVPSQVAGTSIRAIAENHQGQGLLSFAYPADWRALWEWDKSGGIRRVRNSVDQVVRMLAVSERGDAIALYSSQEIWIREGSEWSSIKPMPGPLRNATSIFLDRTGRLWVGSANGLQVLRADQKRWGKLNFRFPDLDNHVVSLLAARDGSLWGGSANGIVILSPQGGLTRIKKIGGRAIGMVTGLAQDKRGAIWCSSGSAFLGAYRYFEGRWRHYGVAEGLAATNYHRMQADETGRLWALSSGGGRTDAASGAYLFNGESFSRWDVQNGLPDSRVYSVVADSKGAMWFGTVKGISKLQGGKLTDWSIHDGLRANAVFSLRTRKQGGVYFTDRRSGLGEIGEHGKIRYTPTGKSAATNQSWEMGEDAEGNLWLTTRGGLFVRRDGEWNGIGQAAGLENLELWPLAFWRGYVCTGSDGGGMFCLNRETLRGPVPKVVFSSSTIENNNLEVGWRALGFNESGQAKRIFSRYRMDRGPWSEWQGKGSAKLMGLASGTHTFEVEAKDLFGSHSNEGAEKQFVIPAPLFRQPVFYVPVGLSLVAALFSICAFLSHTMKHNRALAAKEESFRALIEYSSVGITLWDRNRRIFYVSPAIKIILGYEPEELLGDFRDDLIHPEDRANSESRLSGLLEVPGQTQRSKVRMLHKSGEYRWIEVISRNLFDNASVGAIVTNLRDITDSTNAEMAAAEARERAEKANQSKSDFLAMISHEIRTPMNGITGMSQLLLETNLNKDQQDCAETIAQSAQSLLALVNDVLDFSRIEAGKLSIERAPIDLSSLVGEVAQLMRVRADEKGVKLRTSYPVDAPRAFYGDALRIRQILFNLTGNAVKFTGAGEVKIEVKIEYVAGSEFAVSVLVRDTGIGIEAGKLQMVFQKFTQADLSTTRRYGGSGLGLSISRSLAELMGGSIHAKSEIGQGSEFRLDLHLDAAPENSLQRKEALRDLVPLLESLDILLVEDNKVNQKLAVRLLERLGCKASVAENGLEALALLDRYDYDLILMDCQMPEMDGYETTRRIREGEHGRRRVPILAVTANAMESDLERCLTCGMDAYLTKPIDFIKLRDALETWGIDYRAPRATSGRGGA